MRWDIKQNFSPCQITTANFVTSAHWLAVIPARVAGVDALNGPWALLHDEAWGAAKGDGGAQLIGDVAAAEIPVGDVRLPAVFVIEGFAKGKQRICFCLAHCTFYSCTTDGGGSWRSVQTLRWPPSTTTSLSEFAASAEPALGVGCALARKRPAAKSPCSPS